MRRRGYTMLIGALLTIGLLALVTTAPVPYVELVPGPTYNTLGIDPDSGKKVIEVTGAPETPSAGQLRFLTIGVITHVTLAQALLGWWNDDDAVVPRELIIPAGETEQQIDQRNADDFANSQSAASTAADIALGYPLKVSVREVVKGQPADGKLQAGDQIVTVDGAKVDSPDRLVQLVRAKPVGTTLSFGVLRGGAPTTVAVTTTADDQNQPRIGISSNSTPTAPFTFKVPVERVGGPSAGMMLTLGMIDKVKPEDLTGGKIIAGTGTIDALGNVGPIGGVAQKIVAAKAAGAQYFLTPDDNCAEAVANNRAGLPLIRVKTLNQALDALATLRAGGRPELCPGGS